MNHYLQWFHELKNAYGPQGWWPVSVGHSKKPKYHHATFPKLTDRQRFEIAVGAILTQNTAWKNVVCAIENLHKANIWTPDDILRINISQLQKLIRKAGYFRQKAKKLRILADEWPKLTAKKRSPTRLELLALWGIGEETADSILLYAFNEPIFVIDAYTKKLCAARGIHFKTYHGYQFFFQKKLPKDFKLFQEFHALIVAAGKAR